jgi:hypothetical protein
MTSPATIIGTLTPEVQKITGLGAVPVIAVAGHDTASAVAAVPAANKNFAYLSSGTWSLMGIETGEAIINDRSFGLNFTNEGGIDGTTRFLKNICGMWIYERCRKEWPDSERKGHAEMLEAARACEAFRSIIDPDDAAFVNPTRWLLPSMPTANGLHNPPRELPQNTAAASSTRWPCATVRCSDGSGSSRMSTSTCCTSSRRLEKRTAQSVYGQRLRSDGAGWSAGRHGHRQHHAAGQGRRRRD